MNPTLRELLILFLLGLAATSGAIYLAMENLPEEQEIHTTTEP